VSCLTLIISRIGERPTLDQIKDFLITIKNASYHKQMVGTLHRYHEFVLKLIIFVLFITHFVVS